MKYCSIGGLRGRGGPGGRADTGVAVDGLVGFECTRDSMDIAAGPELELAPVLDPEDCCSLEPAIHVAFLY